MIVVIILLFVVQGVLAVWLLSVTAMVAMLEWDRFGNLAKHANRLRKLEAK